MQRHHVLLEGLVLDAPRRLGPDGGRQFVLDAFGRIDGLKIRELVLDQAFGGLQRLVVAKPDFNALPGAIDA